MTDDQREKSPVAKQVTAGGSQPPEPPPQSPADTAGPGDTESVPHPADGDQSALVADEATLPPRSIAQTPSVESATLPPRPGGDADEPRSQLGNARVHEAACSRLEKSWFDGERLSIEDCLEHVPEPELVDTTEELVCIELEFFWKQSGPTPPVGKAADTESLTPTSLEDYLKRFPELDTPQRLERLVSAEIACRLQVHAEIDADSYRQRFPELIADNSWVRQRVDAMQQPGGATGLRFSSERTVTPWQPADAGATPSLRSFGDYELLQEIARGGMGVVYKARQTKLNRVVALKMILSGQLASQEDVQRFYVEAEAAASLEHPGIVPIYEIGEHDEQHFFSMGFVDGSSLESQVKDGPLSPREAAVIMQRVSEAIAYAHRHGVIHRDLKPANILIDSGGEPKVTDFGLAKKTDRDSGLTGTGQILGTPGYMPPEQASGETDRIGPAADIYSLGAILYALLTGRPPFQAATAIDTLVAVLEQEPVAPRQLNPTLDSDLETVCLKCLEKDASRRYRTADALLAELERYLHGEPIHARPIGRLERTWRWCKRKPAVAGLCALAAIVFLMLGIGGPLVAIQQSSLRNKSERALAAQLQAEHERRLAQVNALQQATPQAAASILRELDVESSAIQHAFRDLLADSSLSALETNRVRLGLLVIDHKQLKPIAEFVLSESGRRMPPEELLLIRDVVAPYGEELVAQFLPLLESPADRLWASLWLAGFAADEDFWSEHVDGLAADLVRVLPSELRPFRDALRPVQEQLIDPLNRIYQDAAAGEQTRAFAIATLGEYLRDDPAALFELLVDSSAAHYQLVYDRLMVFGDEAGKLAQAEIARSLSETASEADKDLLAERQANCIVLLLRMGQIESIGSVFGHSEDPRRRSLLIHRMAPLGVDSSTIIARFNDEKDTSARRALLLCLGAFDDTQISTVQRQALIADLLTIYRDDPDPGMHSTAEWLLSRWQQTKQLAAIDKELMAAVVSRGVSAEPSPQWFINSQGQTLAIVDAGEFQMGSPTPLEQFKQTERRHHRRISRRYAIATKEVTRSQWAAFVAETKEVPNDFTQLAHVMNTDDCPIVAVNWYGAAHYCNWLSEREGILEDQWCYHTNTQKQFGPGIRAKDRFWELTGYRLPTEAEWEFACRAGATTEFFYGQTDRLLTHYAWNRVNSGGRTRPVGTLKPNDLGLFDTLGNVFEWCYNVDQPYAISTAILEDAPGVDPVTNNLDRIVRGGSFDSLPASCRPAFRGDQSPRHYTLNTGLRVVRTMPSQSTEPESSGPSVAGMTRAQAVTHLEQLLEQQPEDEQLQSMLAVSLWKLASQLAGRKREQAALDRYQQAAELFRALGPVHAKSLFDMAPDWADLLDIMKKNKQAVEVLSEAVSLSEQLQKNDPQNIDLQATVAILHKNLGLSSFKAGNSETCEEALKTSRSILERLVAQQPKDAELWYKLSQAQRLSAMFFRSTDRLKEGLVHQESTVASFQKLTRLEPENSKRYLDLAVQTLDLAEMWDHVPDPMKAEKEYRAAEALFSMLGKVNQSKFMGNRIAISRLRVAELSLLRGAHADAVAMAVGVGQIPASHSPVSQRFAAARILALAVAVVFKDSQLETEQKNQAADRYGLAAMMMFKQLEGRMFFMNPQNVKKFLDDLAFKTLEDRQDYQMLLKSLDKLKSDKLKSEGEKSPTE